MDPATFIPSRSSRRPTRIVWKYADGKITCPSDDNEAARLFRKMIARLDDCELMQLQGLIARRRVDLADPTLLRLAREARAAEDL